MLSILKNSKFRKNKVKFPIKNTEKVNEEYIYSDCETDDCAGILYYENEGTFDGAELKIDASYAWGQFNYETCYVAEKANPGDVKYLVEEQFYCPTKGVPLVERFYEEPFENLEEAKKYFDEMKVHEDMDCGKELLIFDTKTQPRDKGWYNCNVKALLLMKEKGQTHLDASFRIFVDSHIEELEKL